jgi:membrane-bound lytic murein transglycosylase A
VLATIRALRKLTLTAYGAPDFAAELARRFEFITVSDQATITGYHTPLLQAREQSDADFRTPILGHPPDLVESRGQTYRRVNGRLVAAPTRAQIMDGAYDIQRLAIAWTDDPVEFYYAQIQGGATLAYPDGRRRTLLFAGCNGYPFVSFETVFLQRVPAEQRPGGYFGIHDYLRRHPDEADRYFRLNPRYIFFRLSDSPRLGMTGLPLTPGRSIATDKSYYSAGLVGYLVYSEPTRDGGSRQVHRLVCDSDTGSAITGPARVDVYYGEGNARDLFPNGLKTKGTLAYLLVREGM